jgi:addiction module HigA family antidote
LGLSVTEGAEVLGVSRQTLNNVIHGKSGISPEMAIRLRLREEFFLTKLAKSALLAAGSSRWP